MRATAIRGKGAASFEAGKPACQVLILHEDFSTYSHAVEVCRQVMERFADELDFAIKCWNFIELADPNCARLAAKTAGSADVILLSLRTPQLPVELDRWLDAFFIFRFRPEGTLALVLKTSTRPQPALDKLVCRLKRLAEKLDLDFISLLPGDDATVINLRLMTATLHPTRE